ncbi:MAG TPA: cyclase family protein [Candidatus Saccharimonadales bacterium]|nr:cyclase family protein [Candidatus Saccharimonadales bacterium]
MPIVDLTVSLNEQTPVYPGDPAVRVKQAGTYEKDGYRDHVLTLGTHSGTHIDAPMHMLADGQSLDKTPIEQFVGPGNYVKTADFNLETVRAANIQAGDIVLFHTGASERFMEASYYEDYPAMSEDVARYLVELKVKMVGLDTGSADNQDGFPIHKILFGGEVLIIENLTNLAALADKTFTVYALPLKLNLDGAPARVVAVVD